MKPAALGLLRLYEKSSLDEAQIPGSTTIGELAASITGVPTRDDSRIQDYIGKAAAGWGAKDFRMEDVPIPVDFTALSNAIETTLADVLKISQPPSITLIAMWFCCPDAQPGLRAP